MNEKNFQFEDMGGVKPKEMPTQENLTPNEKRTTSWENMGGCGHSNEIPWESMGR